MSSPVLVEGDRLLLRELTPDDVPALRQVIDDPLARRYVKANPAGEDMDAYVAEAMANAAAVPRTMYQMGVVRRHSDELIGRAYVTRRGRFGVPELGMVISERHRGQNFGTETKRLLLRLAFEVLDLDTVWSVCQVDNIPTQRANARVGMRLVRRVKDREQASGGRGDSLLYVAERDRCPSAQGESTPGPAHAPVPRFAACPCLRPTCPCPVTRHYALEVRSVLRALARTLGMLREPVA